MLSANMLTVRLSPLTIDRMLRTSDIAGIRALVGNIGHAYIAAIPMASPYTPDLGPLHQMVSLHLNPVGGASVFRWNSALDRMEFWESATGGIGGNASFPVLDKDSPARVLGASIRAPLRVNKAGPNWQVFIPHAGTFSISPILYTYLYRVSPAENPDAEPVFDYTGIWRDFATVTVEWV